MSFLSVSEFLPLPHKVTPLTSVSPNFFFLSGTVLDDDAAGFLAKSHPFPFTGYSALLSQCSRCLSVLGGCVGKDQMCSGNGPEGPFFFPFFGEVQPSVYGDHFHFLFWVIFFSFLLRIFQSLISSELCFFRWPF